MISRCCIPAFVVAMLLAAATAQPQAGSVQSDLDAFMADVLERRDENWKKLQQCP
jgi:hypothetical protein